MQFMAPSLKLCIPFAVARRTHSFICRIRILAFHERLPSCHLTLMWANALASQYSYYLYATFCIHYFINGCAAVAAVNFFVSRARFKPKIKWGKTKTSSGTDTQNPLRRVEKATYLQVAGIARIFRIHNELQYSFVLIHIRIRIRIRSLHFD